MLAVIDQIMRLVDAIEGGGTPDLDGDATLIAALDNPAVATAVVTAAPTAAASTIRIPVVLLETMLGQVSDLVLARNDLARRLRGDADLLAALGPLTKVVGELRESIGRARLQPIERLFRALPRLVRDTAAELGKQVALTIAGDDVEIDREMVEALKDPLTHIIRNAIDHGVERDRAAVRKSAQASLSVTAGQSGNQVTITIADDGRGIDLGRLTEKAAAAGIAIPADDPALLIFAPGLSTAAELSAISGRGVGMDVVRENIERIGGSIALDNRPGQGLTVTLRVPLTLSILTCLIVEVGGQRFAIPRGAVEEVVAIRNAAVRYETIGDGHLVSLRGELLSVAPLATMLGLSEDQPEHLIVVAAGGTRFVLPVAGAAEHEELVVRPLAPGTANAFFAGQSLCDDGSPTLVLDPVAIASAAGIGRAERRVIQDEAVIAPRHSALTFLAVDGALRALPASAIQRIEDLPRSAFVRAGENEWFVTSGDTLLPVAGMDHLPDGETITTLRICDNSRVLVWPVDRVCDLVPLGEIIPVQSAGQAGFILVEGQPIPLMYGAVSTHARKLAA